MANFDNELSRLQHLMSYKTDGKKGLSNLEYFTEGADGKVYGILKEGNKYYIKTTQKGKERLSENYEYINGFNYRNENGYKSYNEAMKRLGEKLVNLNECYGVHTDVNPIKPNRGEKILEGLTKEARKELDRVNMIFENSNKIGCCNFEDKESKGKACPCQTEKNNDPFSQKTDAKLDKDLNEKETDPKKANSEYTDASKNVEKQLTTGEPKGGDTNAENDFEKAKSDLEGVAVASAEPKGGKAVVVKEGLDGLVDDENIIETPLEDADLDEPWEDAEEPGTEDDIYQSNHMDDEVPPVDDDDFDVLMEKFNELLSGDDETLTGPHGKLDVQTVDGAKNPKSEETEAALKGPKGNGQVLTWDKLNESTKAKLNPIIDGVVNAIFESRKQPKRLNESQVVEKVMKLVKEDLNAWGKHPKYGKQPMTTPDNREVFAGTADRDWNDDSAKGSEQYGKKIGNGKPFDKVVNLITDSVLAALKESQKKK